MGETPRDLTCLCGGAPLMRSKVLKRDEVEVDDETVVERDDTADGNEKLELSEPAEEVEACRVRGEDAG